MYEVSEYHCKVAENNIKKTRYQKRPQIEKTKNKTNGKSKDTRQTSKHNFKKNTVKVNMPKDIIHCNLKIGCQVSTLDTASNVSVYLK